MQSGLGVLYGSADELLRLRYEYYHDRYDVDDVKKLRKMLDNGDDNDKDNSDEDELISSDPP